MVNRYRFRANINWLNRKRDSLLKRLVPAGPFVDGSVVKVRRRCGNKNCRCVRGEKHESLYLMYKVKGVTKAVYIPVDIEEGVKEWVKRYKTFKRDIQQICKIQKSIIRRHVKERRQKRGRR